MEKMEIYPELIYEQENDIVQPTDDSVNAGVDIKIIVMNPIDPMDFKELESFIKTERTRKTYIKQWTQFVKFSEINTTKVPTESLFLKYLEHKREEGLRGKSLQALLSSLSTMCSYFYKIKFNMTWPSLGKYVADCGKGETIKKANVFSTSDINNFLLNWDSNNKYILVRKAIFIIGFCGGLPGSQLRALTQESLKEVENGFKLTFKLGETQNSKESEVIIPDAENESGVNPAKLLKKYVEALHNDVKTVNDQSPLFYHANTIKSEDKEIRFHDLPMGGDFLKSVPRWIAEQLELPNPSSYSSNSLRRSLAANAAENSSTTELASLMNWKHQKSARDYIEKPKRKYLAAKYLVNKYEIDNENYQQKRDRSEDDSNSGPSKKDKTDFDDPLSLVDTEMRVKDEPMKDHNIEEVFDTIQVKNDINNEDLIKIIDRKEYDNKDDIEDNIEEIEDSDADVSSENMEEILISPDIPQKSLDFSAEDVQENQSIDPNQLENVIFTRELSDRLKDQEEKHETEIRKIKQEYQGKIDNMLKKFNNQLETFKSDINRKKEQLQIKSQINGQLLDKVNSLTKQRQQSEQEKNDLKVDVAAYESKMFLLEIQIKNLEDKLLCEKKRKP